MILFVFKGHAPAGGCLLAMSCEYRIMVNGKFTIGLNETALGIVAPTWFMDTMCHTIPIRQAEYALTTARMFSVDEALKVRSIFLLINPIIFKRVYTLYLNIIKWNNI